MFNYLFPIFCFGLVISGVVYLGIIEAAKQAKSMASVEKQLKKASPGTDGTGSGNGSTLRIPARTWND